MVRIKVVSLGDCGVGKSCLIKRWAPVGCRAQVVYDNKIPSSCSMPVYQRREERESTPLMQNVRPPPGFPNPT
jgi:hypothetical protein